MTAGVSTHVRQTFRPGANGLPESFGFVGSRRRQHRDEPGDEFEKPTAGRCWPCASERLCPRSIGWRGRGFSARGGGGRRPNGRGEIGVSHVRRRVGGG